MASHNDIARETNTRFWLTTFYKPGVALSNLDSADRFMARRWLEIYRDLVRQNWDGVLSLTYKHPSLAARLTDAINAYRVEASTNERDPRYAEARNAKTQALGEAAMWEELLTSPSRERIVGAVVGAADTRANIDQLHAEIMQYGQGIAARVAAETSRIQQVPAHKILRDQMLDAWNREESLPPGSWERIDAVARYRALQDQVSDDFNRRARSSPILVWERERWEPFRMNWLRLREGLLARAGESPGWGREYVSMVPSIRLMLSQVQALAPI